jgi:putative ABC transport system permease protein
VQNAGLALHYLIGGNADRRHIVVDGVAPPPGPRLYTLVNWVGGDFFETLRVPMRRGRALGPADDAGAPPVAVVNEAFARRFLPDGNPIGQRVNGREIVGVAGDTKYQSLREAAPPMMFVPFFQEEMNATVLSFQIRTTAAPAAMAARVGDAIAEVAPGVALSGFKTARAPIEAAAGQERLFAWVGVFFGASALLLAAVGLYGLIAHGVARRTREIGVRVAVGAHPMDILGLVVGDGMRLVVIGAGLGLAGALLLTRAIASQLYGVAATDPLTFAGMTLILIAAGFVACAWPARRALSVDPTVALRSE